jgi:hypothetical protein
MSKVVGKAKALARGYYPVSEAGNYKVIEEGEVFDLREGHTKGKWFVKLEKPKGPDKEPADTSVA